MHRAPLRALLAAYRGDDEEDRQACRRIAEFVDRYEDCFERSQLAGHVTASAWILDATRERCLLTHHRKLDRWLQLGGHTDGETDVLASALREAREESGLVRLAAVDQAIFDCDVHRIPARGDEPEHWHYDVRFLLAADGDEPLVVSAESKDLAWVALSDVARLSDEPSLLRMAAKARRALAAVKP